MRRTLTKRFWIIGLLLLVVIGAGISVWLVLYKQKQAFAIRTACCGNLIRISLAKRFCQEELDLASGQEIPLDELNKRLDIPLSEHICHAGGKYIVGPVGDVPECSFTNVVYTFRFDPPFGITRMEWFHNMPPDRDR